MPIKGRAKTLLGGRLPPGPTACYGPAWKTILVYCDIMYYSVKYEIILYGTFLWYLFFVCLHIEHKYYN